MHRAHSPGLHCILLSRFALNQLIRPMLPPRHGSCARFFPTLAIQSHAPEQHHYRIASVERLFGTAARTESRSVRAAPTIPAASVGEPRRPASAGTGDVAAWFYPSHAASHADAGSEDQAWPGAWLLRIARGAGRESLSIGVSKSHRRQLFGIEHLYRCAPKTHFPV